MKTPSNPSGVRVLSPLTIAFFAAALLGALTAIGVSGIDFAGLITSRISQAHGAISPDTTAWLRSLRPSKLLFGASALLAVAGLGWRKFHPTWVRLLLESETGAPISRRGVMLGSALAVLVLYFRSLPNGFFRYDDFDLLGVARDYHWWETLGMLHGDHFLPLVRILASLGYACFGVTAWPYNLCVLLCMWGVVAMGCRLLDDMGISRVAQALFLAVVLLWSPWAELMAGCYILSIFMVIAGLGLTAVWSYRRWAADGKKLHAAGLVVCASAAPLVDVSGWYVPAAVGVFMLADFAERFDQPGATRTWFARHGRILTIFVLGVGMSLAGTVYFYAVVNRGAFLSMGSGGTHTSARLIADFAYVLDVGLLGSMAVPYIYARLPTVVFVGLALSAFLAGTFFAVTTWRSALRRERILLLAIAAVLAGICLMVVLGRPSGESVVVRWAAKHVGPAYVWWCLLLTFGWQIAWTKKIGRRRVVMAEVTLIFVGIFWVSQSAVGALGLAVSFPPFGYPAELRDAKTRRANLAEIEEIFVRPLTRDAGSGATVPNLDGSYIRTHYPSLFEYNLTRYLPFFEDAWRPVKLVRNSAMQRWTARSVTTVPVLREAVSPAFLKMLAQDSSVRRFYFGPFVPETELAPMRPTDRVSPELLITGGTTFLESDGSMIVESRGVTEIPLSNRVFDPEAAPRLRVAVERLRSNGSSNADVLAVVAFESGIAGPTQSEPFVLPSKAGKVAIIDLRQIYAWSLAREVAQVRLVLTTPGHYRLSVISLGR